MDKEFTDIIEVAFSFYKKNNNISSDYKMCADLDISRSTFANWKKGRSLTIRSELWEKIEPVLKPYIKEAEQEKIKELSDKPGAIHNCVKWSAQISEGINKEDYKKTKNILDAVADYNTHSANKDYEIFKLKQEIEDLKKDDKPLINFPHITEKVSAGNGVYDDFEPYGNRPDLALMDVKGESMQPNFNDGEKVVVHLYQTPVVFGNEFLPMSMVKAMIPEDSIIVYERNGDGRAMKQVKYDDGKNTWYLKLTALNTDWAREIKFKRIVKKGEDFKIIGVVLGKLK